jgi:2,5-dioxopentanoate dehydrogenase
MEIQGKSLIGHKSSGRGERTFYAVDPASGQRLEPSFLEAVEAEIAAALETAEAAFAAYRRTAPDRRAAFLREIGEEILGIGDTLIERAAAETGLPEGRLVGERGRTVQQARLFADLVEEGSWVEARIDTSQPDRMPLPKPDLRRMLIPLGPVAVFGASNFPLAFSVAGGDTVSALAAGCPVVVKGHPAHPGTSELVARGILRAADRCSMPAGVFSLLQGAGHEVGLGLVNHPLTRAVGFTGSLAGGRALFDAAARRPVPIPVFAEMGSVNPVFVLPGALKRRGREIAEGLQGSVTLGVGQFCTNPGLVVFPGGGETEPFIDRLRELIRAAQPGTMLHAGIRQAYIEGVHRIRELRSVGILEQSATEAAEDRNEAGALVFHTSAEVFLADRTLSRELFGPSTLLVSWDSDLELRRVVEGLEGQLTATLHAAEEDLREWGWLIPLLERKAGRLIVNGFPTGVEVCSAMHHGGPYPAATDGRTTSVGTAAILRFARPVCYQDFPQAALPPELQNRNRRGIWRLVDGHPTRDDIPGAGG